MTASALPLSEAATALVTLVASQGFTWLSRRGRDQAYARGLVDKALEGALSGVSAQLTRADERLTAMEKHRDECESELEEGRRLHADLRKQVTELMSGPVATYGEFNEGGHG